MKKSLSLIVILISITFSSFGFVNISAIRGFYTGTQFVLPPGTVITGTVISDRTALNLPDQNLFIQDNTGGISLRFNLIQGFNLGDSITVDVSGDTITEFNGLVQIKSIDNASAVQVGTGTIVPRLVTVADIINNMAGTTDTWESTLVKISNATIRNAASTVYLGSDTVRDGTAFIIMFTRSLATFAPSFYPTANVDITAIVTDFNAPQIAIRNLNDVQLVSGILENSGESSVFEIAPNPVNEYFTISLSNKNLKYEVAVLDMNGKVVFEEQTNSNNNFVIDASRYAAGIYNVLVKGDGFLESKKLVVNH